MVTTFQLKEGATTTNLNNAGTTRLSKYTPATKNIGVETVTETATIVIVPANAATLDSERAGIIDRLYNAKARQTNHVRDKTYIHFQPDGAAAEWRSEIVGGRIANEKNVHGENWGSQAVEFSIIWERRNYWEGAEAQVPLTNTNGTDNTAGLNIYNCNDGAGASPNDQVNYCDIKAADVDGELPAATRIEMINNYATAELGYVWIGQNFTDPANHVWSYEGEDAVGGTPTVNASSSGGDFNRVSVADHPLTQELLTWTIAGAVVDDAKGGPMKVILRLDDGTNDSSIWFRIRLEVNGSRLYESPRTKPDGNYALIIRDIVTFNFPPWLRGETGNADVDLILCGQQETGGALTEDIDVLFLIPADGWRYIQANDTIQNTERLVDDGINGVVYADDAAGADKRSAALAFGSPIMLEPGKLQRLYFLTHSTVGDAGEKDRLLTTKVFYRPRRYTV